MKKYVAAARPRAARAPRVLLAWIEESDRSRFFCDLVLLNKTSRYAIRMIAPPELYRGYHNLVVQRRKLPRPSPRRCLFGSPDPKETIKMLQEALEVERARFIRLWGVDPFVKDDIDERTVTWVIRVDRNRNTLTKLTPSKRIPNRPSRNLGPCIYKQTVIPGESFS